MIFTEGSFTKRTPDNHLTTPSSRSVAFLLFIVAVIAIIPDIVMAQDSIGIALPDVKPYAIKWWQVGAVAGAGLLAMTLVDEPVHQWVIDPGHHGPVADEVTGSARYFGQAEVVVPVTAGIIVAGLIAQKPALLHSGLRIGASVALAGLVTGAFKYALGVERPYDTEEPGDFDPGSGNSSMWSGHTAMAFSFATALSQEIHEPWATAGLYSLATATAVSRVYQGQHWVSDVLVGAAVGIGSAKLATGRWTIFGLRAPVPLATPNSVGVMWHGTF